MKIISESEKYLIRHAIKPLKVNFRNRNGKVYVTISGEFAHNDMGRIRKTITEILRTNIYLTSGGFGKTSSMTLRLNPEIKTVEL